MSALAKILLNNEGNRRIPCPLYGCKRVYTEMAALDSHIRDHQIPTQSLPGKLFLCSTTGCGGSFPNMQKLMEHTRHHLKPNIFFSCENCRAKLRSYRGLLTHLHTCSKVPRGKMKAMEPMDTQPAPEAKPSTSPAATDPSFSTDQNTPTHDLSSVPMPLSSHIQTTESGPTPPSQPDSAVTSISHPPCLSIRKPSFAKLSLKQSTAAAPHSQPQPEASYPPASLSLDTQTMAPGPPQPQVQPDLQSQPQPHSRSPQSVHPAPVLSPVLSPQSPQSVHPAPVLSPQSPQSVHPAPVLSPQSPHGPTAVWKKNQGQSFNSRILWQHTRGQYRCVQCGHSVPTRREMTTHLNSHHRNPPSKPTGDTVPDKTQSSPSMAKSSPVTNSETSTQAQLGLGSV